MESTSESTSAFDRGVAPVLHTLLLDKAADVVAFRPDPALQERIDELASRCTEGVQSDSERSEYEGYVRANKFIAVLQRQARKRQSLSY